MATPPRPDERRPVPLLPVPPDDGLTTVPWKAIEALPVGLIALAITSAVAAAMAPSLGADSPTLYAVLSFVQEAAMLTTVLLWVRFVSHGRLAALGAPRRSLPDLLIGVAAGLVLIVLSYFALKLVLAVATLVAGHEPKVPDQVPRSIEGWQLALTGVSAVILAPIAEETFFRGFLYQGLRRRFSVWTAMLLSSALFGLVHVYLLLIPALFVVGMGLAFVYQQRRSLLASIAAHATFNVVGFIAILHRH